MFYTLVSMIMLPSTWEGLFGTGTASWSIVRCLDILSGWIPEFGSPFRRTGNGEAYAFEGVP